MIGTIDVRCNAAKPNFPLQPMFAFMGSPSSIRVLDIPKSIGTWEITSVRVAVLYPNNLTIEKVAVRTGSVWVATIEGCEVAGKVGNGLSILADGIDEGGNEVSGYVLGKGDVFILEDNSDVKRLLEKYTVRYLDEVPASASVGDLLNINGQVRLFDGERWLYISNGEEPTVVNDSQITIQKNGTSVGSFTTNAETPVDIDIPVPSRTSDIVNDVGYITANALPTKVSELENDSGFITLAQVPTPSYIEDASGNRIEADGTCSTDDWACWRIDGTDEVLTGEKGNANNMPSNPEEGDVYYDLHFWDEEFSWELMKYAWVQGSWFLVHTGIIVGTIDFTTLDFTIVKLVQVNASGTLATQAYVDAQIGQVLNEQM